MKMLRINENAEAIILANNKIIGYIENGMEAFPDECGYSLKEIDKLNIEVIRLK